MHLRKASAVFMQTKREQLADLAMAIFMRDPPNDPKNLYETQDHSSVKLSGLGTAHMGKGNKREVCSASRLHCTSAMPHTAW